MNLISGNRETSSRPSALAYSPRKLSKRPAPSQDGDRLCLFAKRLERGRLVWPRAAEDVVVLSRAQLSWLLEGIGWRMPRRTWRPELAG